MNLEEFFRSLRGREELSNFLARLPSLTAKEAVESALKLAPSLPSPWDQALFAVTRRKVLQSPLTVEEKRGLLSSLPSLFPFQPFPGKTEEAEKPSLPSIPKLPSSPVLFPELKPKPPEVGPIPGPGRSEVV